MKLYDNRTICDLNIITKIDVAKGYDWNQFVVEEIGELLSAISRYQRGRCGMSDIVEESADVILTILAMVYRLQGPKELAKLEKIIESKIERTIDKEGDVLNG